MLQNVLSQIEQGQPMRSKSFVRLETNCIVNFQRRWFLKSRSRTGKAIPTAKVKISEEIRRWAFDWLQMIKNEFRFHRRRSSANSIRWNWKATKNSSPDWNTWAKVTNEGFASIHLSNSPLDSMDKFNQLAKRFSMRKTPRQPMWVENAWDLRPFESFLQDVQCESPWTFERRIRKWWRRHSAQQRKIDLGRFVVENDQMRTSPSSRSQQSVWSRIKTHLTLLN